MLIYLAASKISEQSQRVNFVYLLPANIQAQIKNNAVLLTVKWRRKLLMQSGDFTTKPFTNLLTRSENFSHSSEFLFVCFLSYAGRLSCWQLWDVTPTVSTSCWRKERRLMLQTKRASLHYTELYVYLMYSCVFLIAHLYLNRGENVPVQILGCSSCIVFLSHDILCAGHVGQ